MSIKVAIKLVLLLTALTATIVAIFWLKQGHMASFWTSLGLGNSGQRLNWCEERVASLHFYHQDSKLLEKEGKWYWINETQENELDYLRVEKWFAKYCHVDFKEMTQEPRMMPQPLFEAHFINGERLTVHGFDDLRFRIREQNFQSENLSQGLKELLAFDPEMK